jgi:hypothetical protein
MAFRRMTNQLSLLAASDTYRRDLLTAAIGPRRMISPAVSAADSEIIAAPLDFTP